MEDTFGTGHTFWKEGEATFVSDTDTKEGVTVTAD